MLMNVTIVFSLITLWEVFCRQRGL